MDKYDYDYNYDYDYDYDYDYGSVLREAERAKKK